jgi:hypothetical protein
MPMRRRERLFDRPFRGRVRTGMVTFEYMRLLQQFRGCEAFGPGSEQLAKVEGLDAMLAALGAEGWELVTVDNPGPDSRAYLFKRRVE